MTRPVSVVVLLLVVLVQACSGEGESVAGVDINQVCERYGAAGAPIERRVVEADLMDQVEVATSEGDDSALVDVLAALRDACPDVADALLGTGVEAGLASEVSLDLGSCGSDEVDGEVTNEADVSVNVRVLVRFTDDEDVLLDTRMTTVSGLQPGQTGRWSVYAVDSYDRCRATIDTVAPS